MKELFKALYGLAMMGSFVLWFYFGVSPETEDLGGVFGLIFLAMFAAFALVDFTLKHTYLGWWLSSKFAKLEPERKKHKTETEIPPGVALKAVDIT